MLQRGVSVLFGFFVCLVTCVCLDSARSAAVSTAAGAPVRQGLAEPAEGAVEGSLGAHAPVDVQNLLTGASDPSSSSVHVRSPSDQNGMQHEAHYDEDPEEHDEGHDEPCAPEQLCQELWQVDQLNDDSNHEEAYQRLLELDQQYGDNVDVLWRLARVIKKRADLEKYQDDRENMIFQGYDYISTALKHNNSSFSVHKWFAILAGERGEFLSVKERLKGGQVFKKHLDIALTLKPKDSSVHHLLGMFNYKVSMLTWFEITMAETLFGDVPEASFSQAIHHFLEARKYGAVCWKANDLYIAKSYIQESNYADAALWLERAQSLAIVTDNDARYHEEVLELLEDYQEYRMISSDDDYDDPERESCPTIFKDASEVKKNSSCALRSYSWMIFTLTIAYLFAL